MSDVGCALFSDLIVGEPKRGESALVGNDLAHKGCLVGTYLVAVQVQFLEGFIILESLGELPEQPLVELARVKS